MGTRAGVMKTAAKPENHLEVEPVCTTCHADRERVRRA